ncbi:MULTISPECIES: hypothetical protein [Arthrobacter]|uniref:hypothetical protein n=1 Tax=Arthrobacter TaxID=1663 RepID=UPI001473EA06|nr:MULTISPECIES: hypothetical protein [Arthrobacter]NYG17514.1 hypothetical protein [Arthrobacter psychrochitiniphilus]
MEAPCRQGNNPARAGRRGLGAAEPWDGIGTLANTIEPTLVQGDGPAQRLR